MHQDGSVARWLQSVKKQLKNLSWDRFCSLIHERFGKDQHQALMHQMFHICQTGSVHEYVQQFSRLVDQLLAYDSHANPLYFAMHFVDGLRDDIKSVVMVKQPSTLDTACALALVQEEAMDSARRFDARRFDHSYGRHVHRYALPPPEFGKPIAVSGAKEKRTIEPTRAHSVDDKFRALKQF
jgi:hypothetical protein